MNRRLFIVRITMISPNRWVTLLRCSHHFAYGRTLTPGRYESIQSALRWKDHRHLSTNKQNSNEAEHDEHVPYGPKDTLLVLGYSMKGNDIETHIQALKETLKLKMMTLDYYSEDMAQSYTDLAMAQHQSVQFINEAKANYLKAYEIWVKLLGRQSREVANALCLIGVVLRDIGDIDAARSAFQESLDIDKTLKTVESQLSSVLAINNLAGLEHLRGNLEEAISLYEEAIRIILTATGGDDNHRMIALLYYNLACCHKAGGDDNAAETALLRARGIIANIGDANHITGRIGQLLEEISVKRKESATV